MGPEPVFYVSRHDLNIMMENGMLKSWTSSSSEVEIKHARGEKVMTIYAVPSYFFPRSDISRQIIAALISSIREFSKSIDSPPNKFSIKGIEEQCCQFQATQHARTNCIIEKAS